jgi:hypothetical protein
MRGLLKFAAVVFLACLLFLVVDVSHRVAGYQAVHGHGIQGTVTVTSCEAHRTGTFCTGDFKSADRRVTESGIRINGAAELLGWSAGEGLSAGSVRLPAALSPSDTGEAWTADGDPWLQPSAIQLAAMAPVAAVLAVLWRLLSGGPRSWQYRAQRARMRRMRRGGGGVVRREMALARMSRRGRVH